VLCGTAEWCDSGVSTAVVAVAKAACVVCARILRYERERADGASSSGDGCVRTGALRRPSRIPLGGHRWGGYADKTYKVNTNTPWMQTPLFCAVLYGICVSDGTTELGRGGNARIRGKRSPPLRAQRDVACGPAAGGWHDGRRDWAGRGGGWTIGWAMGDVLACMWRREVTQRPSWDGRGTCVEVRCASFCSLALRSRFRRLRGHRAAVVDACRAEATAKLP